MYVFLTLHLSLTVFLETNSVIYKACHCTVSIDLSITIPCSGIPLVIIVCYTRSALTLYCHLDKQGCSKV